MLQLIHRGYDDLGRVAWESDPAQNGTWYAYDSLGRRTAVTNALGQVTHTAYDAEGRTVATRGATYPVAYEYDAYGRMTTMATYRDEGMQNGDTTTWFYDDATGLLTNKVYADSKGTAYSYTSEGKLASRQWARGVTTGYSYDDAGSLTDIVYSEDTPPVTFTYDRLGRMTSAVVAGVSTNAYTYDPETLALSVETQNGMEINRTTDAFGRDTGFNLGTDYSVQYGYDAYGRFVAVTSLVSSVPFVANYSYLDGSDLLSGMTASSGFLWTRAYESARSLITSVENRFGETVISRYDYENDALGRRTAISRSGLAFGDMPVRDAYGYNLRSEVVSARRTLADTPSQQVRGFSYDYAYDPIGNRVSSTEYDHEDNALISDYTANALNQYEQRTVPGYAGVRGNATNTATVMVNANPAWRWGKYFYGGDDVDNSMSAVMKQLAVTAVYNPPGTNAPDVVSSITGHVFVAKTHEQFTYDADGNMTSDGRFTYTWNGENRLIVAETRNDLSVSVPRVRVEYAYDHQGRRIFAEISIRTNDVWQAAETRFFLYDGWNVIEERIGRTVPGESIAITNHYVWGLDLSSTLQGAGGISGLLAAAVSGTNAFYCYDANGNITELVGTDGAILAHYEYSPLGETVVSTGLLDKINPFRFSTKWFDLATGMGDWGYRWYSPRMGRWANRDPVTETGSSLMKRNGQTDRRRPLEPNGRSLAIARMGGTLTSEELWHLQEALLSHFRDDEPSAQPLLSSLLANPFLFCHNAPVQIIDPQGECLQLLAVMGSIVAGVAFIYYVYGKLQEIEKKGGFFCVEAGKPLLEIAVEGPIKLADPPFLPFVSAPLAPFTDEIINKYAPKAKEPKCKPCCSDD